MIKKWEIMGRTNELSLLNSACSFPYKLPASQTR